MQRLVVTLLAVLVFACINYAQNAVLEKITYLKADGKSYLEYNSLRSGYPSLELTIPREENPKTYYEFFFPNTYTFEKSSNQYFNKVTFDGGDNSFIIEKSFEPDELSIDENGVYTFKVPKKVVNNNNYGISFNDPSGIGFSNLAYVWIIPEQYEFVSYNSNREGDWVIRDQSLSFFGYNVNNVLFEIKYRKKRKTPATFLNREVQIKKKILLNNTNQTLKIRDHQKEDGDIISVSLNGEWIAKGLKVTNKEVELSLKLEKGNNFLIMYAENEGTIPPNTAAMRINEEEIIMNSTANSSEALELYVN